MHWKGFSLPSDDGNHDSAGSPFSPGVGTGAQATSGAAVPLIGKNLLSVGQVPYHLHTSSDDSDRGSAAGVQLPESSKVTATRRNLAQLFGEGPSSMTAPATATSRNQCSSKQTPSGGKGEKEAPFEYRQVTMDTTAFLTPRFDYESIANIDSLDGYADPDAAAATNEAAAGLITAQHAFVHAYRDTLDCGTCMLAIRVPSSTAPSSVALRRHHPYERRDAGTSSNTSSAHPALLLISSNHQVLCRLPLDATDSVFGGSSIRLHQGNEHPQHLTFFYESRFEATGNGSSPRPSGDASSGCWWTCVFADCDMASRFLVAAYTVAQYAAALAKCTGSTSASVPSVRTLPSYSPRMVDKALSAVADDTRRVVRADMPATICWQTWTLRRVNSRTSYYVPESCLEIVPLSAPRTVVATDGTLLEKAAAALVGMRSGESRLIYLRPEDLHLCKRGSRTVSGVSDLPGSGCIERGINSPAVVYLTCLHCTASPRSTPAPSTSPGAEEISPPHPPAATAASGTVEGTAPQSAAGPSQVLGAVDTTSTNTLLQQLLLHFLQQQQQQAPPPPPQQQTVSQTLSGLPAAYQGPSQQCWESVECTLDRLQLQLGSLCERVDHLDIEGALRRNNTELERVIRRVAGVAGSLMQPDDIVHEDALKDRDALLGSLERYRNKFEEANANYQRALEAMGPLSDRVQALERDLRLQQDLWDRQRRDEAEQMRLRLVERDALHREELERVGEERYAAGRSEGHAEGYQEGRQVTLLEVEGGGTDGATGSVVAQWRAKLLARDQEISTLQTTLQEAKLRHERDRLQLRAEIDVLSQLKDKLQHLLANDDVRVPGETVQQQCKRLKRTLNAVYNNVEGQLLQHSALQQPCSYPGGTRLSPSGDDGVGIEEARETLDGGNRGRVVPVDDVLSILTEAIRSEAQAAVLHIRSIEAQRTVGNAELRELTASRWVGQQSTWGSCSDYWLTASSAVAGAHSVERGEDEPVVERATSVSNSASTTSPAADGCPGVVRSPVVEAESIRRAGAAEMALNTAGTLETSEVGAEDVLSGVHCVAEVSAAVSLTASHE